MSLSGTGAAGGVGGVVVFATTAWIFGGPALLSDAGYAFLGVVSSALIGAVATVTVAVIGLEATRSSSESDDEGEVDDDPAELRRRAAEIERRKRRSRGE